MPPSFFVPATHTGPALEVGYNPVFFPIAVARGFRSLATVDFLGQLWLGVHLLAPFLGFGKSASCNRRQLLVRFSSRFFRFDGSKLLRFPARQGLLRGRVGSFVVLCQWQVPAAVFIFAAYHLNSQPYIAQQLSGDSGARQLFGVRNNWYSVPMSENAPAKKRSRYNPDPGRHAGLAARKAAAALIKRVVDDRASMDRLCDPDQGLASWRALIAKDRALARAIAMAALRHRGRIDLIIDHLLDRSLPQRARHLHHSLHAAAAQILFMEVPDRAAIDLAVTALSGERRSMRFSGLGNAILRRMSTEKTELLAMFPPGLHSFTPWLAKALRSNYGRDNAIRIAEAVSVEPALDLTVRPGLPGDEQNRLVEALGASVLPTGGLRLVSGTPVVKLTGYDDGLWWVQDAAASLPAQMLGDVSGMAVADLCAAPGGKTAQLAAMGAKVTAVDISSERMERLSDNLKRLNLECEQVVADLLEWQPGRLFDAVLLDAPCSSTGTIRRHPDCIWTKTAEDVALLVELQRRLIASAAALVRPGGRLVYANCSILKAEGEDLAAAINNGALDTVLPAGVRLRPDPLADDEIAGTQAMVNRAGALRTLPYHLPSDDPAFAGMDSFFACRFTVDQP